MNTVQQLRLNNGLRQADIARLIGVSSGTYNKKENGTIRFSLAEAKIIADFFDLSLEEVFFTNESSLIERS